MSQVVMNWKLSCAWARPVDAWVLFSTKVHAVLAPARKTSDSVFGTSGGGFVVSPGAVVSLPQAATDTTSAIAKKCRTCFIPIISRRSMAAANRLPTDTRAAPKVRCYMPRVPRRFGFVSGEPAPATHTLPPCPTTELVAQDCLL